MFAGSRWRCCRPAAGREPILKIGLSAPFTGWDEPVGYSVIHAVRLALRESYQRGGAGGYMLELVALDDRNDPAEAARQAREFAVDPDVLAAIGGLDNEAALAAAPAYQKEGLALVTIAATAHRLTESGYAGVFRLAPRDQAVAQAAVDLCPLDAAGQARLHRPGPRRGGAGRGADRGGAGGRAAPWSTPAPCCAGSSSSAAW